MARRLPDVPVVVAERRVDGARAAIELGADLLLLDDGYQHLALARDVNILLLDAADPFGGGSLPPSGRLREPLSALSRADAVVFTRVNRADPPAEARAEMARLNPDAPIFTARLKSAGLWDESKQTVTETVCPYCGVGCNLELHVQDNKIVKATSPMDHDITNGHLCIKGRFGWEFVNNLEDPPAKVPPEDRRTPQSGSKCGS